ncbi:MAG: hypothetical protein R3C68_16560 [Myxococcota bacterium]
MGYKLLALLLYRRALPDGAKWWLFGDDVESDAEVFTLFGDVCAGLRGEALAARLREHRVRKETSLSIVDLADSVSITGNPIEAIFIHLEYGGDPKQIVGPKVVATHSYLQTALVLRERGRIVEGAIGAVVQELRRRGVPETKLPGSQDAVARLGIADRCWKWSRHP